MNFSHALGKIHAVIFDRGHADIGAGGQAVVLYQGGTNRASLVTYRQLFSQPGATGVLAANKQLEKKAKQV